MPRDVRNAVVVLAGGALLLVLGLFVVIASQPIPVQEFGSSDGQGQAVNVAANGVVLGSPWFLSHTTGGLILTAGAALAAGIAGYTLGGQRRH